MRLYTADCPLRMPFFPLPPPAGIAINLAILVALVGEDPANTLVGIATPLVAALAYPVLHRPRPRA